MLGQTKQSQLFSAVADKFGEKQNNASCFQLLQIWLVTNKAKSAVFSCCRKVKWQKNKSQLFSAVAYKFAGVRLFSWMGYLIHSAHTFCHIQSRSKAFLLNGSRHAFSPCCQNSCHLCCRSRAFLLNGSIHADHTLCHIQCRSWAFLLNGSIHAFFQCWWMSRLICCKSGAFLLGGLIHADYTFLHIQCRSRAFLLCWQISCHICCKSRATFMSVGASICPQTGQTGKIGFQILKS